MIRNCWPLTNCFPILKLQRCRAALLLLAALSTPVSAAKLALIIDDVGERHGDEITLTLPQPVTLAFLPYSRQGRQLAIAAWRQQREIMLHLPMATLGPKNPGPYPITAELDKWQVQYRVKKALADIPFVSGVNNHMGSAVTPDAERMDWVMEELAKQQLYFVDSFTIASSVAQQRAQQHGIATTKRQVFLDPARGGEVLAEQWQRALAIAKAQGQVVVIGHPYPDTMTFLQQQLPLLAEQQIELVPVSQLVQ
ncbi:divergent polysaccharide deacetylase family protein [Ferrimonas senticii]|uniref:divergent polysaccharide deacetylase family protein n=1 Tax=Ferrimonas senticii TaxID=394566 RepID=UPI0009FF2F42|nr:divergent polysaccharide deacetylase family protein [Ferrimonas senticii]